MKKVVSDRRASLDEETEIRPARRRLVEEEFRRAASIPVDPFPAEGSAISDTPRLTLVVADPEMEWTGAGSLRSQIAEWTRQRGRSPRLYPGALVFRQACADRRSSFDRLRTNGVEGLSRRRQAPAGGATGQPPAPIFDL